MKTKLSEFADVELEKDGSLTISDGSTDEPINLTKKEVIELSKFIAVYCDKL